MIPEGQPEDPSPASTVDVGPEWEDHGKKVGIAEAQLEADKARAEYFQVAKQEEKAEQAELSNKHLANMAALDKACSIANTESHTADPKDNSLQVHNKQWATRHDLKLQNKPGTAHSEHEKDSKSNPPKPESFGHTAFLSPDEQCPPKKRGRKPKESTATGSSKVDEGESSKAKTRGRSRVRKSKVAEENEAPPTKRPRKSAGKDKGSVKQVPMKASLPEVSPSNESPTAKKDSPASRIGEYLRERKRARLERMDAHDTPQHEPSADGSKPKRTRKSRKADEAPQDEASADGTKRKRTRKSRKADEAPQDEASAGGMKTKRARKSRKTDKPEKNTKDAKKGSAKPRKAKPYNKPAKKYVPGAEKKKELSRKSSAYHVAYKHTEGTEEEKRAAAKKVL